MSASPFPPECTVDDLLDRYDLFLIDAYGVLVNSLGPLPGAAAFLHRLDREAKSWLLVSNDASRSVATTAARYQGFGLPITGEQVLTSGALLTEYFAREGLAGSRCVVLGTDESKDYVRDAGGLVVDPGDETASVCVVCGVYDLPGAPFVDTLNRIITVVLARLGTGRAMRFILPNPDVVYPSDVAAFSFTAGGVAALLEAVIRLRDTDGRHAFEPLGKPHALMFETALRRFPHVDRRRVVMIGDQLGTDVLGARGVGLDAVLIETGVACRADLARGPAMPTWLLPDLVATRTHRL
jgi:4-nitrophenyl phosphatase